MSQVGLLNSTASGFTVITLGRTLTLLFHEIDHYYDKLSEGGTQQACGWLKDKFGVSWQVTPPILMKLLADPDREKAGRVTEAMFEMKKIIITDLEAAAAG